ncbi:MAG: hypothetical protein IJI38_05100 [Clostridia bacterium]|nr:hypothetical protein [Clostridia bacterium]
MNAHLMDLGFEFRETQIWKRIDEDELFAVRLPQGITLEDGTEYVFCSILGRGGEHRALSVNLGKSGLLGLRRLYESTDERRIEQILVQNCIQCSIETAEQFSPEDLKAVRAEAQKRNMRKYYPQFNRYRPHCYPWHITDEQDEAILTAALEVTLALDRYLKGHRKSGIHLQRIDLTAERDEKPEQLRMEEVFSDKREPEKEQQIPVFSVKRGELSLDGTIPLPEAEEPEYPKPSVLNELGVKKISRIRGKGVFECEVFRIPHAIQDDEDEAPYFPAMLMLVDEDGMVRAHEVVEGAEYDPEEMINELIQTMIEQNCRPEEIRVRTDETFSLLRSFCQKTRIRLVKDKHLELLDEAKESLMDYARDDGERDDGDSEGIDVDEFLETLEEMPEELFLEMPDFIFDELLHAAKSGMLPPETAGKISRAAAKRR